MTTNLALTRNVSAEWDRLWSVRSTWLVAVGGTATVLGFATLIGANAGSGAEPGGTPWTLARGLGIIALLGVLVVASIAATADHVTRGIVPTLQWTPRREILLTARTSVIALTSTILGLLVLLAVGTIIWLFAPQLNFAAGLTDALTEAAAVYGATALLCVGIGLATRSTAATLTTAFALILVLPVALQALPFDWITRLIELLPGSAAFYFMLGEGPGNTRMTTATSFITLAAWSVAALASGGWRLLRTDADS